MKKVVLFTMALALALVLDGCGGLTNALTGAIAPTVSSISPTSGKVGTVVTITGNGLSDSNNSPQTVTFNGVPAAVTTYVDSTHITVKVPNFATTGSLLVTSKSTLISSTGIQFTVN